MQMARRAALTACLCLVAALCRPAQAEPHHKKWIIVTTINYPTESIRILAKMSDWKVLVVADRKTPEDWQLDNVEFLSMEKQKELKYTLGSHIGFDTYARKNLGYLRAIELGAEEIYETDDDNEIVSGMLPNLDRGYYVYNGSGRQVVNPYAYFGYPTIWPRGYPLDQIRPEMQSEAFSRLQVKPLILQGLADKDPDVDAIFRLTQPMGIDFDKRSPAVVLPEGLMCPFNSQNTLFQRDALWGTLIPITTSFRVCDIWRGYWVQRLIWELEGNLAFTVPTVDQFRNPHRLMKDFIDEDDLYKKAGEFVDFLIKWKPAPGSTLPAMMVELAQAMAAANFWEEGDVGLMKSWVADLESIGYRFPTVRSSLTPSALLPVNWDRPTPEHWNRYGDVVLVVMFNAVFPGWLAVQKQLSQAYTPIFRQIVWTGFHLQEGFPNDETWVSCDGGHHGFYMYQCFANVMQEIKAPPSGGYLIIGDDTIISHCQIKDFNNSMVWYQQSMKAHEEDIYDETWRVEGTGEPFWHWHVRGVKHMNDYLEEVMHVGNSMGKKLTKKLEGDARKYFFGGVMSDAFYVPAASRLDFAVGAAAFEHSELSHEIVVPTLLGMITPEDGATYEFKSQYMLTPDSRDHSVHHLLEYLTPNGLKEDAFMMHPLKLSQHNTTEYFWNWWTHRYSC